MSSSINEAGLHTVELKLQDGTVLNVQWQRKIKATGDDGTLEDHGGRFHKAFDGHKGRSMVMYKVQGNDGEERLFAGYNGEGWPEDKVVIRNPNGFIAEVNPADQTLKVMKGNDVPDSLFGAWVLNDHKYTMVLGSPIGCYDDINCSIMKYS
jgi:hypothetical protein